MDERYADPSITVAPEFEGARDAATPTDRLRSIRRSAHAFRERFLSGPKATFFASFDVIKAPYPTKYGLRDACTHPAPFLHILNRTFIAQFETDDGLKTLIAEPLDRLGNARTPFFADLAAKLGGPRSRIAKTFWPNLADTDSILASVGLQPEDIDYVTYDHLHTQNVAAWLGGERPYFPNAKLLVTPQEWASAKAPLPYDARWYCPDGLAGVPESRVQFFEHDIELGGAVAMLRTPGHTEGNHSIAVHTDEGIFVTSENGVAADAYAPEHSRIPGLRKFAKRTGAEVILNGNTLERTIDQYLSMVLEKEVAGPSKRNPDFPNVAPSSEMTSHLFSPGLSPTFHLGAVRFGTPRRPQARSNAA
ncbi:MAG: hypothetical protein AAGA54_32710 [Myxococcota bacterium]